MFECQPNTQNEVCTFILMTNSSAINNKISIYHGQFVTFLIFHTRSVLFCVVLFFFLMCFNNQSVDTEGPIPNWLEHILIHFSGGV